MHILFSFQFGGHIAWKKNMKTTKVFITTTTATTTLNK